MQSLYSLIDLSTVCVAMHDGFKTNDDGETIDKEPIEMDPKVDKPGETTPRDRRRAACTDHCDLCRVQREQVLSSVARRVGEKIDFETHP